MKKFLVLLLVLATASMAQAAFEPALEILVNGTPWDGESDVDISDYILVTFVDNGDQTAPGSFSVYNLDVSNADYSDGSYTYNLPNGMLGGNLALTDNGTSINVAGGALYSPVTPMPDPADLFWFEFHVIGEPSDILTIDQSGAYGGVDMADLVEIHIAPEPTTICLLGLGALGLIRRRRKTA